MDGSDWWLGNIIDPGPTAKQRQRDLELDKTLPASVVIYGLLLSLLFPEKNDFRSSQCFSPG